MRELTALLEQPAGEGYPAEYLLARIRGRRAKLIAARLAPVAGELPVPGGMTATAAREQLRAEFCWVYRQMNDELRQTFAPLFFWFELRTILLALRFRRAGERGKAVRLLSASLLAEPVRQALTEEGDPARLIDELAGLLATVAEPCRGLGDICRQQGWKYFEQGLVTCCLERMPGPPVHPLLREFFRALIDLRNLVTLAKQLRWQLKGPSAFIRGGELATTRLEKAREEGTPEGLAALLGSLPGMGAVPAVPGNPEPLLLGWLTRKLRALGRDPLGIGLVLDYLWNCSVEARRLGLLFHGQALDRETMAAELIG
jgi:hypothetical protein